MTGSPFSNVVGHDPADSTFQNVLATQDDDTDHDRVAPDNATESSVGVETAPDGTTHEAGQDETAGQSDTSGTTPPA